MLVALLQIGAKDLTMLDEKVDDMKNMQGNISEAYNTLTPNHPNLRNPMQPDNPIQNPIQSRNKDPPQQIEY